MSCFIANRRASRPSYSCLLSYISCLLLYVFSLSTSSSTSISDHKPSPLPYTRPPQTSSHDRACTTKTHGCAYSDRSYTRLILSQSCHTYSPAHTRTRPHSTRTRPHSTHTYSPAQHTHVLARRHTLTLATYSFSNPREHAQTHTGHGLTRHRSHTSAWHARITHTTGPTSKATPPVFPSPVESKYTPFPSMVSLML